MDEIAQADDGAGQGAGIALAEAGLGHLAQ